MQTDFQTDLSRVFSQAISRGVFALLDSARLRDSVKLNIVNSIQRVRGHQTRFKATHADVRFVAIDTQGESNHVSGNNLRRLFQLYMFGVSKRRAQLGKSYFLDEVDFSDGDFIVDVGANLGDLYGYLTLRGVETNYFGFEPNPADYEALRLNCQGSGEVRLFQVALGQNSSRMPMYVSTSEGDSSLVKPLKSESIVEVDVVRLDEALQKRGIKLLKVEAEGFEPEVIKGAEGILPFVEYVAIDGGPERGEKEETTIEFLLQYLIRFGFELCRLDVVSGMGRALLRKIP